MNTSGRMEGKDGETAVLSRKYKELRWMASTHYSKGEGEKKRGGGREDNEREE